MPIFFFSEKYIRVVFIFCKFAENDIYIYRTETCSLLASGYWVRYPGHVCECECVRVRVSFRIKVMSTWNLKFQSYIDYRSASICAPTLIVIRLFSALDHAQNLSKMEIQQIRKWFVCCRCRCCCCCFFSLTIFEKRVTHT